MRTAESVVLTPCPPGPVARNALRFTLAGELRQAQPRKTGVILVCESLVHKPTLRQGGPCVEKKLGDIRLGKVAQAGIGVQAASRAGVQRGRGAEIVRY